ncbi:Fic family protein [Gillisia limnaea]|uniref:Filamentation induced by cAMP protein Fic n=1 Tax=Gillisia limnaea (strain DSM 15749 / LMG 21470 / R-8282) TaxID=865937 RepID=H2BXM4_GILLR|nr:Fic family protein [Gillisia limnaea]EHQ03148.1 filamentation induced by cAMP protein Fic [Gillisia limnaea DSM 15749]
MKYNWQQADWPNFQYSTDHVETMLYEFSEKSGKINGILESLPEETKSEAIIELLVSEAIKTSEIEGEYLSRKDVMSSIKKNLGLKTDVISKDKTAEGISELMIDGQKTFKEYITEENLFNWHTLLMKGNSTIQAGQWRTHEEPMQVISGAMGKEKIHYEAPPSKIVPKEMNLFIQWFNQTGRGGEMEIKKPIIRAAIAHLYFETIHPFEDGNGRIGRAISEKALSQYMDRPIVLSLSKAMEVEKKEYYAALQLAQRSNEITPWITYFVKTTISAQIDAESLIEFTLKKTKFFDRYKHQLNQRQEKAVRRMLKSGPKAFDGGMNARKYVSLNKTSKPTATRDLQDLYDKGILTREGGGRSTSYFLKLE